MTELEKNVNLKQARSLAKFFQIDLTIKIFGHVIYEFHFPPQKTD